MVHRRLGTIGLAFQSYAANQMKATKVDSSTSELLPAMMGTHEKQFGFRLVQALVAMHARSNPTVAATRRKESPQAFGVSLMAAAADGQVMTPGGSTVGRDL